MSEKISITATINGAKHTATVEPRRSLVDFLRHDLGLVGTHVGCEHGVCGACTVMLDGRTVRSCLLFAAQADGSEVTTIEGIGTDEALHPLQAGISATPCAAMRLLHSRNDSRRRSNFCATTPTQRKQKYASASAAISACARATSISCARCAPLWATEGRNELRAKMGRASA